MTAKLESACIIMQNLRRCFRPSILQRSLLCIPARFSSFTIHSNPLWEQEFIKCGEVTVRQEIQLEKACEIGLGAVIWDSAIFLSSLISDLLKTVINGKTCIELGSGVGLCGLTTASHGCFTILSDMEEVIPLLEENIELNPSLRKHTTVRTVDWRNCNEDDFLVSKGDFLAPVDFILGADLIFVDPDRSEADGRFFNDLKCAIVSYMEICKIPTYPVDSLDYSSPHYIFNRQNMGGAVLFAFEERGDLILKNLGDLFVPLMVGSSELNRRMRICRIHVKPHTTETGLTLIAMQIVNIGTELDKKATLGFCEDLEDKESIYVEELNPDFFQFLSK